MRKYAFSDNALCLNAPLGRAARETLEQVHTEVEDEGTGIPKAFCKRVIADEILERTSFETGTAGGGRTPRS